MADIKPTKKHETELKKNSKIDKSPEVIQKMDEKIETKVKEKKKDPIEVKKVKKKVIQKDVAIANGFSMRISPKQCKYTCRVIRGKNPDAAIARLQAVIDEKRPVPMAGLEVGHKKGKGLAGGKFPKNACKGIMEIVKQAAANAIVVGIENPVIAIAKSNQAAAPYRKAGRKAKRAHIYIEIRDKTKMLGSKRRRNKR